MALNAAILVWDVASVVAGAFTFGTATVAKAAGRTLLKTDVKLAGSLAKKKLAAAVARSVALKEGLPAAGHAFTHKIRKICVTACFPAGTPVAVEEGYRNIGELQVGDLVWAWHEVTGDLALQPVVQAMRHDSDALVELRVGSDTVRATPKHPFWVVRQGWKLAGELVVDNALLRSDGQAMPVLQVTHHTEEATTVHSMVWPFERY